MNRDQQLAWATAKQFAYLNYAQRRGEGQGQEDAAKSALKVVESFLLDAGYGVSLFDSEKQQLWKELLNS